MFKAFEILLYDMYLYDTAVGVVDLKRRSSTAIFI